MKTIYEISKSGLRACTLRKVDVPQYSFKKGLLGEKPNLPEVSESMLVRHYTALSKRAFGVDDGPYPLGSCTMKYNPKLDEYAASLPGFTNIHPLQRSDKSQGALAVISTLSAYLLEISGMDAISLQPCAGAHGEYTGLQLIRQYFLMRGDKKRTKIIVPDSAHGTNPASAVMCGFEVVSIPSDAKNGVNMEELKKALGNDVAGMMLTNPNTLGLFEKNIRQIQKQVHAAGGLMYYDGANLNAIMGQARPGDMGFDVMHFNLHKTFATPHGGGGPGSGPVACKAILQDFLPNPRVVWNDRLGDYRFKYSDKSIGKVTSFYGNFGVMVRALAYIVSLGGAGLKKASEIAVLNANYLKALIAENYPTPCNRHCMHEFVVSLEKLKEETGVSAMDIAKSLIDNGIHPPTMYFPLIVHEALMFEPTETEEKESLERIAEVMNELYKVAHDNPDLVKAAPHSAVISRPDEVMAARKPILRG